jgi:hypothetical protein
MRFLKFSLALLCVAAASALQAQPFFNNDLPEPEEGLKLPAAPYAAKADKLIRFDVPAANASASTLVYFLDADHLSLGSKDRVVRYVLIARRVGADAGGNISYEGIRCSTGERRVYAFLKPDGQWSLATGASNDWSPLRTGQAAAHQLALAKDILCDVRAPLQPRDIAERLTLRNRSGGMQERERGMVER